MRQVATSLNHNQLRQLTGKLEAAHHRYLLWQIETIRALPRQFWHTFIAETDSFPAVAEHHAATQQAITDDDPGVANAASPAEPDGHGFTPRD